MIERRAATLFINSVISKDFPRIRKILTQGKEYPILTDKEENELNNDDYELMIHRFPNIYSVAVQEWKEVDNFYAKPGELYDCELCGHKKIEDVYKLRNTQTGKEFVVGSSCIDYYLSCGKNGKNRRKKLNQNQQYARNLENVSNQFPDYGKDTRAFNDVLKNNILLFGNNLKVRNELIISKEKIDKLLRVRKKVNEQVLKDVEQFCNKRKRFLDKVQKYYYEVENNDFRIKKEMSPWVYKFSEDARKEVEKVGKITINNIVEMKEPDFMKRMILKLQPILENENNGFELNDYFDNTRVSMIHKSNKDIVLHVSMNCLIEQLKVHLFHNLSYAISVDLENIIKNSKVSGSLSQENVVKKLLNNINSSLNFMSINSRADEVAFRDTEKKKIYVLSLSRFVEEYKCWLYVPQLLEKNKIVLDILGSKDVYTIEEFKEHEKRLM